MKMYNTLLITILVLFANTFMMAQSPSPTKADKLYNNLGFGAAAEKFKNEMGEEEMTTENMSKLADSYRLTGDTWNAEYWYSQVVKESNKPISRLYYAQALQSNGKYQLAKKWFLEYDAMMRTTASVEGGGTMDDRGARLAAACDNVEVFDKLENVEIRNVSEINSDKLDFSPSYYKGGLVFASTRGLKKQSQSIDKWINDNFMDLFVVEMKKDGSFTEPENFSDKLNSKLHEGPLVFTKDEKTVYFTRNNYNKGKKGKDKDGIISLKIYSAQKGKDDWEAVTELPFNADNATICHPTLSSDGSKMYFAADLPGGIGGLDIYVAEMTNGVWGKPKNLGPNVNTLGNEVFPFIHDDGSLFFASNGHEGIGGLDIFRTRYIDSEMVMDWATPENLGTPFNSSKDDFGLILDLTKTSGFFTSDRKGGKGGDDIYSVKMPSGTIDKIQQEATRYEMAVCVYDAKTNERIKGATMVVSEELLVEVIPGNRNNSVDPFLEAMQGRPRQVDEPAQYYTDKEGSVTHRVQGARTYTFRVQKDGYKMGEKSFTVDGPLGEDALEFCIPLNRDNCMELKGKVVNKKYKNNLTGATIILLNQCTGEESTFTSDKNGEFNVCLDCNCDYAIVGQKKHFSTDQKTFTTIDMDCTGEKNVLLALTPGVLGNNPNIAAGNPNGTADISSLWTNIDNNGNSNAIGLAEGMVIDLDKIYYDFDEYYIRADAEADLDKLVALMNRFPTMEVELSSHTDARGSDKYNEKLSQNRAEAAVQYIIEKGIIASRIAAKGYGETRPRKNCKECSEEEHQFNRRTEVKITKFDNVENVKVKYNDTKPRRIDEAPKKRKKSE